jgi:hypothetical protein
MTVARLIEMMKKVAFCCDGDMYSLAKSTFWLVQDCFSLILSCCWKSFVDSKHWFDGQAKQDAEQRGTDRSKQQRLVEQLELERRLNG